MRFLLLFSRKSLLQHILTETRQLFSICFALNFFRSFYGGKTRIQREKSEVKEIPHISIPNDIINENGESSSSSDKSLSDDDDKDFSIESETTEEEILSTSSSDVPGTTSESSRVTKTKAKNVKNAKIENKKFMWKNYSNKKDTTRVRNSIEKIMSC